MEKAIECGAEDFDGDDEPRGSFVCAGESAAGC